MDILMVKRGGRFSGEAYAVLPASSQMEFALAKNKTYMGKRYVEVFRAKKLVSLSEPSKEGCYRCTSAMWCCHVLCQYLGSGVAWLLWVVAQRWSEAGAGAGLL